VELLLSKLLNGLFFCVLMLVLFVMVPQFVY
jgi:hypothetical protein